jgi:cyclopropane fatty-acyl-phospholipid synthase-like methyltransferase
MTWIKLGKKELEYYDDLLIMADTGLHSQIFSVVIDAIDKIKKEKDIHVLDVSAGEGAFSKRLYDNGFFVESIDIDQGNFKYHGIIPFHKIDLNSETNWSEFIQRNKEKYDIVVSMETIEHLENPWMFLRGLKELVKPGGYIVLSTPNIESPWSKFCFFLRDKFLMFMEGDLCYGHINPLTSFELGTIFSRIGLTEAVIYPGGLYPMIWIKNGFINNILWCLVNILSIPFTKKLNYSWCKIYMTRK